MAILSIQSHVALGHVGNGAAAFALQRLGHEVFAVPTVILSNHTGYPTAHGFALAPAQVADLLAGLGERGAFARVDAVLSGYVGDPGLADVILDAVGRARAANAAARYVCDPVMGDMARGLFVKDAVPALMRERLLPAADTITPNAFELGLLSGLPINSLTDALEAAARLRARGPRQVVCTSLDVAAPADRIATLAVEEGAAWLVETPRLAVAGNGAGDLFAALLTAHLCRGTALLATLEGVVAATFAVLQATAAAGTRELAIVAAQDALAAPPRRFRARRLA